MYVINALKITMELKYVFAVCTPTLTPKATPQSKIELKITIDDKHLEETKLKPSEGTQLLSYNIEGNNMNPQNMSPLR